jgi:hypothetical protein
MPQEIIFCWQAISEQPVPKRETLIWINLFQITSLQIVGFTDPGELVNDKPH